MTIDNKENLFHPEKPNVQYLDMASATELSIGEPVKWNNTSKAIEPFAAQGDVSAYIGISGGASAVGETEQVKTYKHGVYEMDIVKGAARYENEELAWSAAPRTVVVSTSNQIGRIWKKITDADEKVQMVIDGYVVW